ncbi:MAG: hypothetical protein R6V60_01625 [Desulfobacterales bacterium]
MARQASAAFEMVPWGFLFSVNSLSVSLQTMMKKLIKAAQNHLQRDTIIYRAGSKAYSLLCFLLRSLKVTPGFFESDLNLIRKILRESLACKLAAEGSRIAFFTPRGWPVHLAFETLLASRLRLDGHSVTFLSCLGSLPLCAYGSINHPPELQRDCRTCINNKKALWDQTFDVKHLQASAFIKDSIDGIVPTLNLENCLNFEYDGAPYGKLVYRGVVWYLRRSRINEADLQTYRAVLISAHIVRRGLEYFLSKNNVDTVLMLNGDFFLEKVASWVLSKKGIRFVTYDYTFHDLLATAVNRSIWDDLSFDNDNRFHQFRASPEDRRKAEEILQSWRERGGYQGHLFWSSKDLNSAEDLQKHLNLDSRPLAVAYTNMTFESSVICKNRVFVDQFEWLKKLIDFFREYSEFQLVIRLHPAEVRQSHWKTNESLYQFVMNELPKLPTNVRTVAPNEKISSYRLGKISDAVLVYSSSLGMELADLNKCVITAAHVHYSNHGFSIDPGSESEYFRSIQHALLNKASLSKNHRQHLVDYVAWLFLHRLTPFEALSEIQEGWPQVDISKLEDLVLSHYPGIQRIAGLISNGCKWWV